MRKKQTDPERSQSDRFIETARQVGADEESSATDALMGRMAKMSPDPKPTGPRKEESGKPKVSE